MRVTDSVTIGDTAISDSGYLEAVARTARTGVQMYLGQELGRPDLHAVGVYRDESAVFSKDSLQTFSKLPVTDDHPGRDVDATNWRDLAVGVTGDEVLRDGEYLKVGLKITDANAVQKIKGGKRELSVGYSAELIWQDGIAPDGTPYQAKMTNIRANHIAIVAKGRAGAQARIGDSWGANPVVDYDPGNTPNNPRRSPEMELRTVVLGDQAVQVAVSDYAAIEAYKQNMAKKLADAEAAKKESDDKKDEEIGSLKVKLKKAEDAAVIDVDALVAARSALVAQVKALDAAIDVTGKTDAELRKAAVVSKLGDAAVAGLGDAEINGMFKALALSAPAGRNPVADAIKNGVTNIGDSQAQMNDAWAKSNADQNAWRNQGGAQ